MQSYELLRNTPIFWDISHVFVTNSTQYYRKFVTLQPQTEKGLCPQVPIRHQTDGIENKDTLTGKEEDN